MHGDHHEEYEHGRGRRHDHGHGHWERHWGRHTAVVPKGFLRYQLLKMLGEKAMSGSEIMSELEAETNGYWKPSPGSIYPLLAWLQDQRCIKEADQQDPGIRRYTLTEEGKAFLENEAKSHKEIDERLKHFEPMWYRFDREDEEELGKGAKDFSTAIQNLFHELRRKQCPEEKLQEARKALDEVTKQIRHITTKLQEK